MQVEMLLIITKTVVFCFVCFCAFTEVCRPLQIQSELTWGLCLCLLRSCQLFRLFLAFPREVAKHFQPSLLFSHFPLSHPSSSKLDADRSLRSHITPERAQGCCVDRGICLGKAGQCYHRTGPHRSFKRPAGGEGFYSKRNHANL